MQNDNLEALKFPIGKYVAPKTITDEHLQTWIATLEDFPERLTQIVASFNDAQLDTPYRTGGWTIRQLVHHISDSHHHSYTRFKWALTEDSPLIKAYAQKDWSNLFDAKSAPITLSLNHLNAVHAKLVYLL
ncbi:MAG: YfiT family bacillithiol transferase, partial [Bacteroidota bacterium]